MQSKAVLFVTCSGKLENKLHGQVSIFTCRWINRALYTYRIAAQAVSQSWLGMGMGKGICVRGVPDSIPGETTPFLVTVSNEKSEKLLGMTMMTDHQLPPCINNVFRLSI